MEVVVVIDNWSYKSCKAPVKSSPPTNQHPVLYSTDSLLVAQPTVSKHWREQQDSIHTSRQQRKTIREGNTPITASNAWSI